MFKASKRMLFLLAKFMIRMASYPKVTRKQLSFNKSLQPMNVRTWLILFQSHHMNCLLQTQLFTESIVYKKLCMLNVTKSPGPDAVHPHWFLKNCADLLAYPLTCIFQKLFQDSHLPNNWKSAIVTPLFKNVIVN